MEAAFGGIELPLRGTDTEILTGLAKRLLVLAGGTSGAVFGTLFNELARAESLADEVAPFGITRVVSEDGKVVAEATYAAMILDK